MQLCSRHRYVPQVLWLPPSSRSPSPRSSPRKTSQRTPLRPRGCFFGGPATGALRHRGSGRESRTAVAPPIVDA